MDSGDNTNPAAYNTFLPAGWYLAEYSAARSDDEQVEPVRRLVMAFDNQKERYERLIAALLNDKLESFQDDTVQLDDCRQVCLSAWKDEFFPNGSDQIGSNLGGDLFALARHVAQNRQAPRFFPFEERDKHDLDTIAQACLSDGWNDISKRDRLLAELNRTDRYWKVLYNDIRHFKSAFDACVNRLLFEPGPGGDPSHVRNGISHPEDREDREPSEEIKRQVRTRDHNRCLCCGSTRKLRIDHISPRYFGGRNYLDNLQTLCEICNFAKGIIEISFRTNQTRLTSPLPALDTSRAPQECKAKDPVEWEIYLRRSINFFFRCSAVNRVEIGQKGEKFRRWTVSLFSGNDSRWLEPHKAELRLTIREARTRAGYEAAPDEIVFN